MQLERCDLVLNLKVGTTPFLHLKVNEHVAAKGMDYGKDVLSLDPSSTTNSLGDAGLGISPFCASFPYLQKKWNIKLYLSDRVKN